MYESPVRPWYVWLRLTLAAFVLAVYTILALASGVARADEGPSATGGEAGTKGATTSQQSGSDSPGTGSTPSSTQHSGEEHPPSPPAETKPTASVEATQHDDHDGADTPKVDGTTATTEKSTAPTTSDSPVTSSPADVSHDKHSAQPTTVAVPAAAEPSTPTVAPRLRSVAPTADAKPATLAATEPTTPAPTPKAITPSIQPNLGLQLPGLVVDVATVTVSAVHTAATIVAQAFGPSSFLGVPYLLATTVANAAAAVGRTIVGAPSVAPAGRFAVDYGLLDGLAFLNPTTPPAGADDPSITVTPEHPLPIILINGTTATQGANWSVGAPVLANAGYKVYTFNYGNTTAVPGFPIQAIADVKQSGLELSAEVDRVLAETHAPKVILIGHSQGGGILPVYYINDLGGAAKVSQLIGLAPSNHGTDFDGLVALQSIPILGALSIGIANAIGPALYEQVVGSPFQQEVYGDGDTRPGVLYTTITSINDEVVTPYTQQALDGPNVTNIVLQDYYPGMVLGHANIFTSPQALALVLDALASNPAANPASIPNIVAA